MVKFCVNSLIKQDDPVEYLFQAMKMDLANLSKVLRMNKEDVTMWVHLVIDKLWKRFHVKFPDGIEYVLKYRFF